MFRQFIGQDRDEQQVINAEHHLHRNEGGECNPGGWISSQGEEIIHRLASTPVWKNSFLCLLHHHAQGHSTLHCSNFLRRMSTALPIQASVTVQKQGTPYWSHASQSN